MSAENSQEYILLKSVDDERKLHHNGDKMIDDLSRNSSMCDQPIQVSQSDLGEKLINSVSSFSSDKLLVKKEGVEKREGEQKEIKKEVEENDIIEKVKQYSKELVQLLKWNREYDSFMQLYSQIAIDSFAVLYLFNKCNRLHQQRQTSIKDESLIRACITTLSNDPSLFYTKAKVEQKVVTKGRLTNQQAVDHINNTIKDPKYNAQLSNIFNLSTKQGLINIQFDRDFNYKNKSSITNSQNKMNLISSLSASIVSLFTTNIIKSNLDLEEFKWGTDYYFFGQKIFVGNNEVGLRITQVFKQFDIEKFRTDQTAYLLSILVASGVSFYFALKLVKSIIYLVQKKKLYNKKK